MTNALDPLEPFGGHYYDWRVKRLRVILRLWGAENIAGKKVLELGCGYGDIGACFMALGADVTFADAREEHLDVVRFRYPNVRTAAFSAGTQVPFDEDEFDYVLHLGVLYHLPPETVKASIAMTCLVGRHVCLETIVSDSADPSFCPSTSEHGYDQSVAGTGCRPSPAHIEAILDELGLRWQRHDLAEMNSYVHCYDWKPEYRGDYDATRPGEVWGRRRLWTIEK